MAATKTKPKTGELFKLTCSEGHGVGIGTVPFGTEVSVDLVYTQPVPGVGGSEGVLFSWVPEGEVNPRTAQLPLADFSRVFKKAGK